MSEEKKIKSVIKSLLPDETIFYQIGKNGVTDIKWGFHNGDNALKPHIEVYKGEKLYCELYEFTEVEYFI